MSVKTARIIFERKLFKFLKPVKWFWREGYYPDCSCLNCAIGIPCSYMYVIGLRRSKGDKTFLWKCEGGTLGEKGHKEIICE